MKFIVDQQLPPALVRWLISRGHETEHVFYIGLGEAHDTRIWDYALAQGAVVITKDADFAERREASATGPSIIWLRLGNTAKSEVLAVLDRNWAEIEEGLNSDSIVEVR